LDGLSAVAVVEDGPTVQSPSILGLLAAGGGLLLAARGRTKGGVGPAILSRVLRLGGELLPAPPGVCSETK